MRTYLPVGCNITIAGPNTSRSYHIDELIGEGANCIVYDAHVADFHNGRKVRIKEFFPERYDITRVDQELCWVNEAEQAAALQEFQVSYNKQIRIQNNVRVSNSFAHVVDDILYDHGTAYIIVDVDQGRTFDQDQPENLEEILETVLALTKVIREYHRQGYLHLDIKPQNFMVLPETREIVKLLDVDSVVKKEDMQSGRIQCMAYSEGWAAPEQLQGRWKKISEQTDIFEIGAVLFEKIMGRQYTNEDITVGAEWDIPGKYSKNVNPGIIPVLKEIFRKTLAASMRRRYCGTDELTDVLENALKVCRQKRYLTSFMPETEIHFVGREEELEHIHELFRDRKNKIFLHGIGGIGKTELAKRYAHVYRSEYDAVVFSFWDGSLRDCIWKLPIHGMKPQRQIEAKTGEGKTAGNQQKVWESQTSASNQQEAWEERVNCLREICNERTLIIIDNFDTNDDENLELLLSMGANVIITTRNDWSDICSERIEQLELEGIDYSSLYELFCHEYRECNSEEKNGVYQIISEFQGHTLVITLIARYLKSSGTDIDQFLHKLEEDGLAGYDEDSDRVRLRKDGRTQKKSIMDHIRYLFNQSLLTSKERQTLATVDLLLNCQRKIGSFMDEGYIAYYGSVYSGLSIRAYKQYTNSPNLNAINELIEKGWIRKETYHYKEVNGYGEDLEDLSYLEWDDGGALCDDFLYLHPLICELIEVDCSDEKEQSFLPFLLDPLSHEWIPDDPAYNGCLVNICLEEIFKGRVDQCSEYRNTIIENIVEQMDWRKQSALKVIMGDLYTNPYFEKDRVRQYAAPYIVEATNHFVADLGIHDIEETGYIAEQLEHDQEYVEKLAYIVDTNVGTDCFLLQTYMDATLGIIQRNIQYVAVLQNGSLDPEQCSEAWKRIALIDKKILTIAEWGFGRDTQKFEWREYIENICRIKGVKQWLLQLYTLTYYVEKAYEEHFLSAEDMDISMFFPIECGIKSNLVDISDVLSYLNGDKITHIERLFLDFPTDSDDQYQAVSPEILSQRLGKAPLLLAEENQDQWAEKLADTLWNQLECAESPMRLYRVILSTGIWLKQPCTIVNLIAENDICQKIYTDVWLSDSEKRNLFYHYIPAEFAKIKFEEPYDWELNRSLLHYFHKAFTRAWDMGAVERSCSSAELRTWLSGICRLFTYGVGTDDDVRIVNHVLETMTVDYSDDQLRNAIEIVDELVDADLLESRKQFVARILQEYAEAEVNNYQRLVDYIRIENLDIDDTQWEDRIQYYKEHVSLEVCKELLTKVQSKTGGWDPLDFEEMKVNPASRVCFCLKNHEKHLLISQLTKIINDRTRND